MSATKLIDTVSKRFQEFGFPLNFDRAVVPEDDTTLFVCSGMQRIKERFRATDGSSYGSIQSCIRTNDLDLIGDGSHLTYFEMIGNFSFDGPSYDYSVNLWDSILADLGWKNRVEIHVHPSRPDHRKLWEKLSHHVVNDSECIWSDGEISGECSEVYAPWCNYLEIGNLVNPLGHSTDVGFGLERMVQLMESKDRVDETSIFNQALSPVTRDHVRALSAMKDNGVVPGNKGRSYVCRRLLRRILRETDADVPQLRDWLGEERSLLERQLIVAKKLWRKYKDKSPEWWWDTCGLTEPDLVLLKP